MRPRIALAAILLVVAGCGSGEDASVDAAAARVERCVERFLERTDSAELPEADLRRYVESVYCVPFERKGWIYDDGTLSIAAHAESESEECVQAESDGETETVPCEEPDGGGPLVLDCAILHLVRRDEVQEYVRQLEQSREVSCDDGTALDRLGARP
jgi:hypothetical protein